MISFTSLRLFILYVVLSSASYCRGQSLSPKWELVWSDEFNDEVINDSIWSKIPRGTPPWKRYMSSSSSCFSMQNGNLVLRGIVNDFLKNDTASYLTGGVYTKGKDLFFGGRIEVRAKFKSAQGAWPAIWMVAEHVNWPAGGEIDIMEHLNYEDVVHQTVHSYYTYTLKKYKPLQGRIYKINPDDYNVYAVEIYPDSLCFYVNGEHNFTYPRIETDEKWQFPFNQPYYLMLDMQLGGAWAGEVNEMELPAEMWVDWVRYYRNLKTVD